MYNLSFVQFAVCRAVMRLARAAGTPMHELANTSLSSPLTSRSASFSDSPLYDHSLYTSLTTSPAVGPTPEGEQEEDLAWGLFNKTTVTSNVDQSSGGCSYSEAVENFLYTKVMVGLCVIGLVGNCINLCILVRTGMKHSSGRIEKFAYTGLVALAFSDLLFCFVLLPHAFIDRSVVYFKVLSFDLIYDVYNNAVINTFIMASTWLTVILALGRYIAVCLPLKARELIGLTFARRTIVVVFVFCALFNMPRFWLFTIQSAECADGGTYYFRFYGLLRERRTLELAYMWVNFLLVTVCPLVILVFCNTHLILALRMSRKARRDLRATEMASNGTNTYITLTLVVIVLMYLFLSSPAQMLNFLRERVLEGQTITDLYNMVVAIVNTLQTVNFALNFVPYWMINAQVRRLAHGIWTQRNVYRAKFRRRSSRYSSFTLTNAHTTQTGVNNDADAV